jgi:TetR/AcrR family transcriptional repressor of nem operon
VREITEGAGVPKGSFYSYFPSKERFAAAVLRCYWSPIEQDLLPGLTDPSLPSEARLARFFHTLGEQHEAQGFLLGCFVGRASLELAGSSELVRAELAVILDRWDSAVSACIAEAQTAGTVRSDVTAGELASAVVEAWQGAVLRGKVDRSRLAYDRFESFVLPSLLGRPA